MLSDKIDKEVFDNAPRLKIIAQYAVGYDNIDIEEATKRGIYVTNTPDVLTEATVDADKFVRGDGIKKALHGTRSCISAMMFMERQSE